MDFTGIASITYTAADMAEAKRLFTDWGLTRVSATRTRLVFETSSGNRIEVRVDDAPGLPPRLEGGSSFREVVFGVATAARRDAIAADLARDREVTRDADGTVHSIDDLGIHIGVRVWKPRKAATPPATVWNRPGARARVDREATAYAEGARPSKIGHIVFAVTDTRRAEAFYRDRLGFWLSDRYVGGAGVFLRWAKRSEHHNVFFMKSRTGKTDLHHVAFEVRDVHEVFGGGMAFARQGWSTEIGPGRHPISSAYFWYFRNPLGGAIEYFCDPDYVTERWKPRNFRVNRFSEWHLPAGIPLKGDGHARPSLESVKAIDAAVAAAAPAGGQRPAPAA